MLSTINRELLKPSSSVALHRHSNSVVDTLPPEADSSIQMMQAGEKPDVTYADIGGSDMQKQEIREAVELPLTHFDLYKQIGIEPPRGVLLYGPPGTGKTMMARAVVSTCKHSSEILLRGGGACSSGVVRWVGGLRACVCLPGLRGRAFCCVSRCPVLTGGVETGNVSFIRMVGSEFVQKYLGEGPRMVRDVFRMAKENAPSIIFIDEIDAIATKRSLSPGARVASYCTCRISSHTACPE